MAARATDLVPFDKKPNRQPQACQYEDNKTQYECSHTCSLLEKKDWLPIAVLLTLFSLKSTTALLTRLATVLMSAQATMRLCTTEIIERDLAFLDAEIGKHFYDRRIH